MKRTFIEPEFSRFVGVMRAALERNLHKGDSWRKEGWDIVQRIHEEIGEATERGAQPEEWADVANFAFFAWARAVRREKP